jgi:hypothetical protein
MLFGHVTGIKRLMRRMENATCLSECKIANLRNFNLKQLVAKAYSRYMNYEVNFLKELPILSLFKKSGLLKIVSKMTTKTITKEAYLFREGNYA